jgi:hypothetical protein
MEEGKVDDHNGSYDLIKFDGITEDGGGWEFSQVFDGFEQASVDQIQRILNS